MCQSSRGYMNDNISAGIGCCDCECGGSHEKNGRCLRCGKVVKEYGVRHWI